MDESSDHKKSRMFASMEFKTIANYRKGPVIPNQMENVSFSSPVR